MLFTVFTPTYNRGHLLQAAYEGLQQQTLTDFEWLIVDDGSTDNTAAIVEAFIAEKNYPSAFSEKRTVANTRPSISACARRGANSF